jgi:CheY-like chemotaxis protein
MLPDIDGFTLCQKIREKHTYPITMLTAKDGEMDKTNGLTLGASDIIQRNPRQQKKCDFPLGFGDGHKSAQVYGGRDASHFDTHRIFYSPHPFGEQRQRSQRRRIVSPDLAG